MNFASRLTRPVVIQLPREIDATNAEAVAARLRAAYRPGAIVIADMANAVFCDSLGTRELIKFHKWAKASRSELRVVRPCAEVLHAWQLLGADQVFAIYPTLEAATRSWTGSLAGLTRRWSRPPR
jgi:anti-anti-sigma factor